MQNNFIQLKDLKKGDIFYENIGIHEYRYEALEDCRDFGYITINKKEYKQFKIKILNERKEETYLLVTDGLAHYNGKFYKRI